MTDAHPPVLETRGLGLTIGGNRILEDVTLEVRRGEFLAVIGPNGAGKTSLFNLLTGLYQPTAGRILLTGRDITDEAPHRRTHAGLARSFQVTSIFPGLTVVENVRLAARASRGGSLSLWSRAAPDHDPAVGDAMAALEQTGLAHRAADVAQGLSHGDKRKIELAIAIVGRPQVLLLDEPTAGMSVEDLPGLIDVVRRIQSQGTTVVMVEHRMDVVVDLADRIAVMHHGSLLACDDPEAVMANQIVQSAYLGEPL